MKHPDYQDDPELEYATRTLYYIAYLNGKPESLVAWNTHEEESLGGDPAGYVFYRIPSRIYELHVEFETFPKKTVDDFRHLVSPWETWE